MPTVFEKIVAFSVALVLSVGFLSSVFRFNPVIGGVFEKRVLAGPPQASITDLKQYTLEVDLYLNDNFGLRSALISGYATFRHFVLNANSGENFVLDAFGVEE